MKTYALTCPVCRVAHDVEAELFYSPRTILATNGRPGLSESCGNHTAAELQTAWRNRGREVAAMPRDFDPHTATCFGDER